MDKIIMHNLQFYGYHGVLKEEKKIGQKFFVDIELFADLKKPGKTDDVLDTVHYGQVYQLVKSIVEDNKYDLIEKLAEEIAQKILQSFERVQEIIVKVKKPEAPVAGLFDYFGVEIRRNKHE